MSTSRPRGRGPSMVLGLLAGALTSVAVGGASAQTVESINREAIDLEGRVSALNGYLTENDQPRSEHPPYTERFADAELLYRLRDYGRASVLFTDLVTNYRDTPAYSNSVFLLGESLFQAGDRLGARRYFREVVTNAQDPFFRPFVQRSLGRLIEIALRTNNVDGIEELFARLNQLPPTEIEAQTTYVRGKYFFLRPSPDYEQARQAFEAVPARSPIYPQARYFLGAILTAQERYPEAIEAFQRVLQLQPEGGEQQQVLDLAALAVGRLNIEQSNYDAAIEAYQQVGRSSPLFDRALFEQAWAFIRSGDALRAERALEILSISNPDSPLIAEGKLLWGNLLLRTGRFERAQQVFTEVRNQFGPVAQRLNELVAQNTDPASYFQQLIQSNIQVFDTATFVPAPALAYVRQEGTLEQSLSVIADLNTCRRYIRESEDLIARLTAALSSPSRAHVFRDLRRAREQVFQLQNRVTQARASAAAMLDAAAAGVGDPNLQGIIAQRRQLEASVRRLPTTDTAVRRRDRAADGEFTQYSQELQRSEVQVANIEAMVVAIERYVRDNPNPTGSIDVAALRTEMTQHRGAIESYRQRINELRRLISEGRSQVGVGDPRYERDAEIAREYRELLRREIELVRAAGRIPAGLEAALARIDAAEGAALAFDNRVNTVVSRRVAVIQEQVQQEQSNVAGYRQRLAQLETESSDVVGHLVMQSFASVRLHFYRIVMRADLGLVDVAWEVREEHNNRARMLAEEQNREIDALNDEFNEVVEGAEQDVRGGNGRSGAPGGASPTNGPAAPAPAAGSGPAPGAAAPSGTAAAPPPAAPAPAAATPPTASAPAAPAGGAR